MGLGLGIGAEIYLPAYYPSQESTALYVVDLTNPACVTFGATPLATGTTPPAVTLSGTAALVTGIRVEITSGVTTVRGVSGGGAFRISFDDGSTFPITGVAIPTSGDYLIPSGAGAGVTVSFPTGTYATNNVYRRTVQTLLNMKNGAYSMTQASASIQPVMVPGPNGTTAAKLNGTSGYMYDSTFQIPTPSSGAPWCYYAIFRLDAHASFTRVFCSGQQLASIYNNGTSGQIIQNNGNQVNSNTNFTEAAFKRCVVKFSNTTTDYVEANGASPVTGSSAGGTAPTVGLGWGAKNGSGTPGDFGKNTLAFMALLTGDIASTGAKSRLDTWSTAKFGIP